LRKKKVFDHRSIDGKERKMALFTSELDLHGRQAALIDIGGKRCNGTSSEKAKKT